MLLYKIMATAAAALSALGAVGSALLCVGHLGVDVPVLSAFSPGGGGTVPAAAVVFAVAALAYGAVAAGALRRTAWAWPAGVVFHGLAVLSGAGNYRGAASGVGIALSLAALAVLFAPAGRRALRRG